MELYSSDPLYVVDGLEYLTLIIYHHRILKALKY